MRIIILLSFLSLCFGASCLGIVLPAAAHDLSLDPPGGGAFSRGVLLPLLFGAFLSFLLVLVIVLAIRGVFRNKGFSEEEISAIMRKSVGDMSARIENAIRGLQPAKKGSGGTFRVDESAVPTSRTKR